MCREPSILSRATAPASKPKSSFRTAIKVDLQSGETRGAREGQRVVLFPEDGVRSVSRIRPPRIRDLASWRESLSVTVGSFSSRAALWAPSEPKSFGWRKPDAARRIRPWKFRRCPEWRAPLGAISFLDLRQKFPEKEILIRGWPSREFM